MPTCGNCRQDVDFYEHGGLFYCNECDTQSQVMHVIEDDKDYSQGFSHFAKSYKTSVKKKITEEKPDDEPEERTWWSCELYQAILKAQVNALLAMGFPSRLDAIVMQLWFRFLSRSGAAFCETPKAADADKHLEETTGDSDEDLETDATKTVLRPKRKRKGNSVCKDEWLSRLKIPKMAPRSEGKMVLLSIWDSVCFMFLGLQTLKEHVVLSDVLRWVRWGHLPLRSTAEVLPEHISKGMGQGDIARFCNPVTYLPDVNHVFGLLKQLSAKLDLVLQPPSQTEMSLLLARVIHTLNLPKELCHYTHRLLLQAPPSKLEDPWSNPLSPECQAVAYAIVALKLLFGLNDYNEHMVSRQTKQLQSLLPTDIHLFNWDVWVEAQKLRVQQKLSHQGSIQDARDLSKVHSMPGFVQHFKSYHQVEPIYKHLFIWTNYGYGRQEKLKEYQRPFLSLNKDSNSSPCPAPSSFPMAQPTPKSADADHQDSSSPSGSDKDKPKPTSSLHWHPRDYLFHMDFASHTLKHLTNLRELCEQHIIPPTEVFKVLDQAMEDFQLETKDSAKHQRKNSKSKSSAESSRTGKGVAGSWNCGFESADLLAESTEEGSTANSDGDNVGCSEPYLLSRQAGLGSQHTPYVTYPTSSQRTHQLDCFHRSMAWLLELCSQMWEMDSKRKLIAKCVRRIEGVLFNDSALFNHVWRSKKNSKF